jgi:hypothetical protein
MSDYGMPALRPLIAFAVIGFLAVVCGCGWLVAWAFSRLTISGG